MSDFKKYLKSGKDYSPVEEISVVKELKPGMYQIKSTPNGQVFFVNADNVHDGLIDLPSTEYDLVVKELELFLTDETKAKFKENKFLYKRSTLLYGEPGSGKSSIINRMINTVTAKGGITLFNPHPSFLKDAFNIIETIQPDVFILVVFEELDQLTKNYESDLLNVLDGEIQKSNVIYMATTNYIDQIPSRIMRPGRFSSTIEVFHPSLETRKFYLNEKLKGTDHDVLSWAQKTDGLSIDELKETVLAVLCLNQSLETVINKIKKLKKSKNYQSDFDNDDIYDDSIVENDGRFTLGSNTRKRNMW